MIHRVKSEGSLLEMGPDVYRSKSEESLGGEGYTSDYSTITDGCSTIKSGISAKCGYSTKSGFSARSDYYNMDDSSTIRSGFSMRSINTRTPTDFGATSDYGTLKSDKSGYSTESQFNKMRSHCPNNSSYIWNKLGQMRADCSTPCDFGITSDYDTLKSEKDGFSTKHGFSKTKGQYPMDNSRTTRSTVRGDCSTPRDFSVISAYDTPKSVKRSFSRRQEFSISGGHLDVDKSRTRGGHSPMRVENTTHDFGATSDYATLESDKGGFSRKGDLSKTGGSRVLVNSNATRIGNCSIPSNYSTTRDYDKSSCSTARSRFSTMRSDHSAASTFEMPKSRSCTVEGYSSTYSDSSTFNDHGFQQGYKTDLRTSSYHPTRQNVSHEDCNVGGKIGVPIQKYPSDGSVSQDHSSGPRSNKSQTFLDNQSAFKSDSSRSEDSHTIDFGKPRTIREYSNNARNTEKNMTGFGTSRSTGDFNKMACCGTPIATRGDIVYNTMTGDALSNKDFRNMRGYSGVRRDDHTTDSNTKDYSSTHDFVTKEYNTKHSCSSSNSNINEGSASRPTSNPNPTPKDDSSTFQNNSNTTPTVKSTDIDNRSTCSGRSSHIKQYPGTFQGGFGTKHTIPVTDYDHISTLFKSSMGMGRSGKGAIWDNYQEDASLSLDDIFDVVLNTKGDSKSADDCSTKRNDSDGANTNTSGRVPGTVTHTNGIVPGAVTHTSGRVPGSVTHTNGIVPGAVTHTSGRVPGAVTHTSGRVPGTVTHTYGIVPGAVTHISGIVPGAVTHTYERVPGAVTHASGLVPGAVTHTSGRVPCAVTHTGAVTHNSGRISGAVTHTSGRDYGAVIPKVSHSKSTGSIFCDMDDHNARISSDGSALRNFPGAVDTKVNHSICTSTVMSMPRSRYGPFGSSADSLLGDNDTCNSSRNRYNSCGSIGQDDCSSTMGSPRNMYSAVGASTGQDSCSVSKNIPRKRHCVFNGSTGQDDCNTLMTMNRHNGFGGSTDSIFSDHNHSITIGSPLCRHGAFGGSADSVLVDSDDGSSFRITSRKLHIVNVSRGTGTYSDGRYNTSRGSTDSLSNETLGSTATSDAHVGFSIFRRGTSTVLDDTDNCNTIVLSDSDSQCSTIMDTGSVLGVCSTKVPGFISTPKSLGATEGACNTNTGDAGNVTNIGFSDAASSDYGTMNSVKLSSFNDISRNDLRTKNVTRSENDTRSDYGTMKSIDSFSVTRNDHNANDVTSSDYDTLNSSSLASGNFESRSRNSTSSASISLTSYESPRSGYGTRLYDYQSDDESLVESHKRKRFFSLVGFSEDADGYTSDHGTPTG
jgi:hypothetical protein